MNCYTVFKRATSHADVLAAIGAADVLRHLDPRIVEFEDRFEVQLRRRIRPSDLDAVDPGFSYLQRPKKKAPSLPPERIVQARAVAENRMYSILGRMKAYGGPNQVISRFARIRREEWAERVWESLHGRPDFVFSSPLVQLFHPHSAKGYALLKPSGTNRSDKTKDCWAEPFLEWLRFRGYFEGCAGWFTSRDLRLFCPIPADIRYDRFAAAAAALRDLRLGGTAAKIDCRVVLGLTRLLIENAETCRSPRQSIGGIWVTHYKDMGQAHTFMAMDRLAIPDWFGLRTSEDAQLWLRTLDQHDTVLRRLTGQPLRRVCAAQAVSPNVPGSPGRVNRGVCGIPDGLRNAVVQETGRGPLDPAPVHSRRRRLYLGARSGSADGHPESWVLGRRGRHPQLHRGASGRAP